VDGRKVKMANDFSINVVMHNLSMLHIACNLHL